MNKALYRVRHYCFSRFLRLTEKKSARRITGDGALLRVPGMCKEEGYDKILLVTTAGFIRRGTLEPLMKEFEAQGVGVAVYSDVKPDPVIEGVEAGVEVYRNNDCKAIVAVGGGSVMDCAKVIGARIARPGRTVPEMRGMMRIGRRLPALFAVPTTAGTGSEVTIAAVVTETVGGTHYKYPITDYVLMPKYAVLDASLTMGLSPEMTAATGMDALTHAVEAYTNLFASRYVRRMATEAVRMIFENLPKAYKDGSDVTARQNMLLASCYAGIAFTNNFVGYVHAIAHGIGGLYGVPHGRANAIVLPVVLRKFGRSAHKTLAQLADAAGIQAGADETAASGQDIAARKAQAFIDAVDRMREEMGIPSYVEELKKDDIPELVRRALIEGNPSYPVPSIWGAEEFTEVLTELCPKN